MVPVGEGVFETLKIVDSRPHALTRHLVRLRGSATALGLDLPQDDQIRDRLGAHLRTQPLSYGRMRLTCVRGSDGSILTIDTAPAERPRAAIDLTLSDWRVDRAGPLVGLKTTNYLDYLLALRAAQDQGFDEALLANTDGEVSEATTANLFFVLDGVLSTPALSTGCLPGVARGLVIELCEVAEVELPIDSLAEASEVFLTSSLREVQPVARIDERTYPNDGSITAEVADAWRRFAQHDWDPPMAMPLKYENEDRVR